MWCGFLAGGSGCGWGWALCVYARERVKEKNEGGIGDGYAVLARSEGSVGRQSRRVGS